jgi:hypothetical protein
VAHCSLVVKWLGYKPEGREYVFLLYIVAATSPVKFSSGRGIITYFYLSHISFVFVARSYPTPMLIFHLLFVVIIFFTFPCSPSLSFRTDPRLLSSALLCTSYLYPVHYFLPYSYPIPSTCSSYLYSSPLSSNDGR